MATLKFKTSINCGNCVKSVSLFLDELPNIEKWSVDTSNADKILTVEGDASKEAIIETVEDAGFEIDPIEA